MAIRKRSTSLLGKTKRSRSNPDLTGRRKRSRSNPDEHIVEESPTSIPQIEETTVTEAPQPLCSASSNGILVTAKRITRSVTRETKDSRTTPQLEDVIVIEAPTSPQIRDNIIFTEAPALILQNEIEEHMPVELHQTQQASTPNIEDIISEDGILCSIMSSLPLREAIRTSVLSPRWRNLWTYLPILKFNATNMLDADTERLVQLDNKTVTNKEKLDLIEENRDQFIQSVNSVLQQRHSEATLDEFWIRYFIPNIHSVHLDTWIHFAVRAKTKQLNVQLHRPFYFKVIEEDPYEFPFHLLGSSSSIERLSLSCCSLRPPSNFDGLRHLKVLHLLYVDLIEEDINHLLSNCYSLKSMSLWKSPRLVSLSIPDRLIQFQNLLVKDCDQLREIKLNGVRLNRLRYWGPPVDFIFKQSSQLKQAIVFFDIKRSQHNLDFYLNKLSRQLPHLEYLSFLINGVSEQVANLPEGFNSFNHLRHLEWGWDAKMSLLFLANFLDAAPFLEKLKLRFTVRVAEPAEPPLPGLRELKEMLPKRHHSHLKTIEFNGFYFDQWQIEIALYLLNNATELNTLKINKGCKFSVEIRETDVRNLRQEVPRNVKFLVL